MGTMSTTDLIWICFGFGGQALFASRMIVQWIASEREGRSIVPTVFWYLSIAGSMVLIAYAIHRKDPVIIVGQATGSIIYIRNLLLIAKEKKANQAS